MCLGQEKSKSKPVVRRKHSLLLTTESFHCYDDNDDDVNYKKNDGDNDDNNSNSSRKFRPVAPTMVSTFATVTLAVVVLFGMEHLLRFMFHEFKHAHHLLEDDTNRMILARHIGVDAAACFIVAYLGLKNLHVCQDLVSHAFHRSNSMPRDGYEQRMYTYHPAAQQLLLLFFAYQVKNLFDSVVWNDGALFIFHHVMAGLAAWGSMYPGCGHFYAIFYMGISEISTAILCLLANFDDEFGVAGLGDAFPVMKIVIGAIFVVAFITFRTVMWPYVSFHFCRDSWLALKSDTPHSRARRGWLWAFLIALAGLTVLQFVWLIQIFLTIGEEAKKMM